MERIVIDTNNSFDISFPDNGGKRIEWAISRDRVNQESCFTSAQKPTKLTSEIGDVLG